MPCLRALPQSRGPRNEVAFPESCFLFLGINFYALLTQHLATSAMHFPIDGYATLKTYSQTAQWTARFAIDGRAASLSGNHHGNGDRRSEWHNNRRPVHRQRNLIGR